MEKLINKLNSEQLNAVKNIGPMLILAGAGSGKTSTMTAKFVYLIEELHISPNSILGLTFSNKAAKEMKDRVIKELHNENIDIEEKDIPIYTFHSFCARILRKYAHKVGFKNNFVILDEKESGKLIDQYIEDNPKFLINKNKLLSYIESYYNNFECDIKDENYIHLNNYQEILKQKNSLDFGSLLINVIVLFEKNKDIQQLLENSFNYILVDEFQDTNKSQFKILKLLRLNSDKICCVGDADQSIYSWRGAEIENILNFEKQFKGCKVFKLQNNYRSTQKIVEIANDLIEKNIFRKEKIMKSKGSIGDNVELKKYNSPLFEAKDIVNQIRQNFDYNKTYAILYRNNALSREFEQELMLKNIGYNILGGFSFYERKEIKDIFSYMKLIYSENDICLERVINVPKRGIGSSKIEQIKDYSIRHNKTMFDSLKDENFYDEYKYSKKNKDVLTNFVNIIEQCKQITNVSLLYSFLVKEIKYKEFLKENYQDQEAIDKIQNLDEFENSLYSIKSIEELLDTFSLDNSFVSKNQTKNNVILSTIHACKGLEFDYVYIVGAEEDIIPSKFSKMAGLKQIEEERRLFYVAITRAKIKLQISYNIKRLMYGKEEFNLPSRFIKDIPSHKIFKKI